MQTARQEDIAASAVSLYQTLSSAPTSPGHKRASAEVSDVSDDDSVQTKRRRVSLSQSDNVRPAPFFYYHDYSQEEDDDPLAPLTPPGSTANFPAKMHAMLSRKDLSDVVAWLPHGRAWRVLKPKVFASDVAPSYFGHSKFASFVRQANGWGFRRITNGPDRGAYYHERFLRGLPHLGKKMKRPGVSEKMTIDPEHEPDLHRISEMFPLPEEASADDGILLESTFKKVRPKTAAQSSIGNSSVEADPRSVTPLSDSSPPRSPLASSASFPVQSAGIPSTLNIPQTAMASARPQVPVAQRASNPVPVNLVGSTPCVPRVLPPVSSLLQAQSLGGIASSVLEALLSRGRQLPVNGLQISPQMLGLPMQYSSGLSVAAPSMGNLSLLQQSLLAASCKRQSFL